MKTRILGLFPHITLILALFLGTLWVLDQLNPMMNFLDNSFANAMLMLLCVSAAISSLSAIWFGDGGGKADFLS